MKDWKAFFAEELKRPAPTACDGNLVRTRISAMARAWARHRANSGYDPDPSSAIPNADEVSRYIEGPQ